jgi:hypothetical protein
MAIFPRSHALRGNVNTVRIVCKLALEASGLTFFVGLSPLTATLLLFERPKRSKQEKSRPGHFLILYCPAIFDAPVRTAHPCAEPNLVETSMFPLAKTAIHYKKNGREFS